MCLAHLLLPAIFFAPFIFEGKVFVGSKDLLDINYPWLLEAYRNFHAGEWGGWNRYVLCGMPSSSSAIAPLYSPENWFLFLLPEPWLLHGVTAFALMKLWLVGWFGFLLFLEETGNAKWAFVAAVSYQLSGYGVWALTTEALSPFLYATIALYLVWTYERLPRAAFYSCVALTVVALVSCSNMLYEAYALALVMGLGVWRLGKKSGLLLAAIITALLLSSLRWLPAVGEILSSTRLDKGPPLGFREMTVLAGRLFNPELFGVSYVSSGPLLESLSASLKGSGVHVHSHMPHYFGVVSILLVGWAVFGGWRKETRLWLFLFLGSLFLTIGVEPFQVLARFTLGPLFHHQSLHLWLPVSFGMCLAHAGVAWEESRLRPGAQGMLLVVAVGYLSAIWLMLLQHPMQGPWIFTSIHCRWLFLSLAGVAVLLVTRKPWIPLGAIALVLCLPFERPALMLPEPGEVIALAGLGTLRFVLVSLVFFLVRNRKQAYPLVLGLLLVDLVPAFKIHGDIVMRPFARSGDVFPERALLKDFDLQSYRAGFPNLLSGSPLYNEIYGGKENLSSLHVAYRIPSYGGYVNAVPIRYSRFLRDWVGPANFFDQNRSYNGFKAMSGDARLLDLFGVRYDPSGERKTALARFQLYRGHEVISDEKRMMERLKSPSYEPRRTIVIDRDPGFPSVKPPSDAEVLRPTGTASDRIKLLVETPVSAVLLFNDSFHPDWKAFLDGLPVEIAVANGNFMAIGVPPGRHEVRFAFEPRLFAYAVGAVVVGFSSLILGLLLLGNPGYLRRARTALAGNRLQNARH